MISSIHLKNFLSYEDVEIPFGPMTVIIGLNLSGKTSIFRALKWCTLNQGTWSDDPYTDTIRRQLEDGSLSREVSVTVNFDNGLSIERKRSITNNLYIIHQPDGEVIEIGGTGSSVGRGYCEDIANLTGIKQLSWPDGTTSFPQFSNDAADGRFLLRDGATSIDTKLGSILGLNTLEGATKRAATLSLSEKKQVTQAEQEIEQLRETLSEFDTLDAALEADAEYDKCLKEFEKIVLLNGTVERKLLILDVLNDKIEKQSAINEALVLHNAAKEAQLAADSAKVAAIRAAKLAASLPAVTSVPVSLLQAIPEVRAQYEQANAHRALHSRVCSLFNDADYLHVKIGIINQAVRMMEGEVAEVKSSMKLCPVDPTWSCYNLNQKGEPL
jgi:DNA repair exonuclease SbcCD ATPase subunit